MAAITNTAHEPLVSVEERKKAWEYLPQDREPRAAETQLTAGPIALPLAEGFEGI